MCTLLEKATYLRHTLLTECIPIVKSTSGSTGYKWTYWILSTDRPTAYVITGDAAKFCLVDTIMLFPLSLTPAVVVIVVTTTTTSRSWVYLPLVLLCAASKDKEMSVQRGLMNEHRSNFERSHQRR